MDRRAVLEQSNNRRTAETTIKSRQGNQSNSNRTRPPRSSKRYGVRLSVTSPPPTFANAGAGTLSPHLAASDISLFGSSSCWISSSQKEPFVGAVAATNNTSNVHIYGYHVTQVRVDVIVLTPESSNGLRRKQGPPPDAASKSAVDGVGDKEKE